MVKNGVEFVIWVCYSVLGTIYKCSLPAYKNTLETHKTQGGILENENNKTHPKHHPLPGNGHRLLYRWRCFG
jgi:hypothetical protein